MTADVTLQATVEDLRLQLAAAQLSIASLERSSLQDIGDRTRLEAQLVQSRRMEAVGILVGVLAHDFNNLLAIMVTYSGFALEALQPGDALYDDIEQIAKAGDRAVALTGPLLAFSREQLLEPQGIDLNALLAASSPSLRRRLPEGIELRLIDGPALGQVSADPSQVEHVILGLVANACEAMSEGGVLTIETANVALDESMAGQLELDPGAYVKLAVTDTGSGMDAATRARVFEPFFTTKERSKHPGVGLSTALGIVEQSGGRLAVHSAPGKGTTCEFLLPRDDSPMASKL